MLMKDGLLDWHDDGKRLCDSPVSVNDGWPVSFVKVEKRRGKVEHWYSGLWFSLGISDDKPEPVKEFTQAFFDQHPEALAALAVVRIAANEFNQRRVAA